MAVSKSRAKKFQDADEKITTDYDPESNAPASDHGSESDDSEGENAGTEHYVSVGKSRLRHKENVSLGPDYRGSRVSRSALEGDSQDESDEDDEDDEDDEGASNAEYDDPEAADLARDEAQASDSEIDSDDALGESDADHLKDFTFRGSSKPKKPAEKLKRRAKAADFMSDDKVQSDTGADEDGADLEDSDEEGISGDGLDALVDGGSDSEDFDEDDEGSQDESEDEEEEDDDDEDEDSQSEDGDEPARPNMAALSNQADVEKGRAIQKQRKIYDGLLNLRIRLQKALVAANTFPTLDDASAADSEPYEAAEEAAIKLLNTISSLRTNLVVPHKTGEKRKRVVDSSMTSESIWESLEDEDFQYVGFRKDRLEKWSRKVQSVNVTTVNGLGQRNKTLIDVLEEQLAQPESRLVKRTRVPRSCAPAQAAKKVTEDENIYDDADFYQVLLKELVDQRTVETSGSQADGVPTVMLTAAKEAKTRKQVDRKASKGRKMRFTVHEKLQNFMAPEDRRSWEQDAIDRFFGTLFGRKMELDEDESEDEAMGDVDAEEEGLRLFRN
ncbi:Protein BFR2 [Hirsutella minnesotensis 3608]|uniref:Protein BFR2 n=1 Tax=Hirsutella minnesotensis 3608 TaxID=1043627 RepID=A0A0F7ZSN0_9HYPO|nr:Protein BFR2 [Hirsutella minnesotensis 3608]